MTTPDEFGLIQIIKHSLKPSSDRTEVGIGDDTAVLKPSHAKQLLCSDCMVEGVHFDLSAVSPMDIAHKAVAACLSDIAAMGGRPIAAVVSLALPKERANEKFITAFYKGIERLRGLIEPIGFDLVGGDLSRSPGPVFIDVACTGEAAIPILRSGAKPGDIVAVSGSLGTSAAGLYAMQNWKTLKEMSGALLDAHARPIPRFDLSTQLDPKTCHALIDISDGLASEAHHIAEASNVGIEINEQTIPFHERAVALAKKTNQSMLNWALYGGEDYELLAAFDPSASLPSGFTPIGRVLERDETAASRVTLVKSTGEREPLAAHGFNHFSV